MRLLIQRFNHYIGRERGFVIIDRAYQELILNSVKKKRSAFQISKKSKNESNKVMGQYVCYVGYGQYVHRTMDFLQVLFRFRE